MRRMKRKGERQEGEGCRERMKQRIEEEMKKGKGRRRKTRKRGGRERVFYLKQITDSETL